MEYPGSIEQYFSRHLVAMWFRLRKDEIIHNYVVTTFIFSVSGKWHLVTAGHCFDQIDEYTQELGYEMLGCRLIDFLGEGAKYNTPVPFSYTSNLVVSLTDVENLDYGFIPLSEYYVGLLRANNIEALDEETWKKQPRKVDFHYLLGIPAELTRGSDNMIEVLPWLYHVKKQKKIPLGFSNPDPILFYGEIFLRENQNSIKGVSGGPIFSFYEDERGELRYWLAAIQSKWLKDSRMIAAYPAKLLGQVFEEMAKRKKYSQNN